MTEPPPLPPHVAAASERLAATLESLTAHHRRLTAELGDADPATILPGKRPDETLLGYAIRLEEELAIARLELQHAAVDKASLEETVRLLRIEAGIDRRPRWWRR